MEQDRIIPNTTDYILNSKVIKMTLLTTPYTKESADTAELMRMRREKVRARRLREGSLISGHTLGTSSDRIIPLYRDELPLAQ